MSELTHEDKVKSHIADCLNTGAELNQYARTALAEKIIKAFMYDLEFSEGVELELKDFDVTAKVFSRSDGKTGFRLEMYKSIGDEQSHDKNED